MSNPPDETAPAALKILVATPDEAARWPEVLSVARTLTDAPFAPERLTVLEALSGELFAHPRLRRDPAGVALGFWLRRANLTALAAEFGAYAGRRLLVPAGLVFHVTPANVDTMFVYSWALAYLVGNANVVRLTTRSSPLTEDLIACLAAVFTRQPAACRGNVFLTYGHDDAISARLSSACDTRVLWGGDETVRRLRAVPLNPHATERAFASKRSLSVIVAGAYLALDEEGRRQVAAHMAADLAPFGQMACSSPHALHWIGTTKACQHAMDEFEQRLEPAMAAKMGEADLGRAVRRLNFAFGAAAAGGITSLHHQPHTTAVLADTPAGAELAEPCGAGLLSHAFSGTLDEVARLLRADHQTLTYFGLGNEERGHLARRAGHAGVDRVVPVGQALDFGATWDGYHLWGDLTRAVVVR